MTDELQAQIDLLKAEIAALKDDRLPKVDRASKRRDRRQVLGGFGMFAVALTVAGTLSASALAGSNTVTSDDIVDNGIYHTDIRNSTLSGADVLNNSLTGADINESTLVLPASGGTPDNDSVTSAKILDGAISLADLNGDAVNGSKVVDDSLTGADIDESTLALPGLADGSVTSAKLADDAVTTDKLADGAVTTDKLADAVTSSELGMIIERQGNLNHVQNGSGATAVASCQPGERVLSGGVVYGVNVAGMYTQSSQRTNGSQTTWAVTVYNASGSDQQFRVRAYCLEP